MIRMTLLVSFLAAGCASTTTARLNLPPLQSVERVDLSRDLGTWHEIASFPQSFQRGCTATTATYSLRDDGRIDVLNRCRTGSPDGPENSAKGLAQVVDKVTGSKLEVSFFRPFWGAYWIIELGDDYGYAVVGHPSRDYLWILSRSPSMDPQLYEAIVGRLAGRGYEIRRLERTVQAKASGHSPAGAAHDRARGTSP